MRSQAVFLPLLLAAAIAQLHVLAHGQRQLAAACSADVVVVGAGIAGLAAAKDLRAAGLNVVVLEGRNRLGGRTWTVQTKGGPIDAGAAWIHGINGNPLSAFVKDLKLKMYNTEGESQIIYDGTTGKELTKAQYARSDQLWDQFEELIEKEADAGESVQDQVSNFYASPAGQSMSAFDKLQLDWNIVDNMEAEYAGSSTELDAARFEVDSSFEGTDQYFDLGYVSIVTALAEGTNVMLNQEVTAIAQTATGVSVTTASKLTCQGKYALVTVPLGVLQKGVITFTPPLPADKQAAITGMRMGLLNKVVLIFNSVFWDEDEWIGRVASPKGAWAEFFSVAYASTKPVLIAFTAADFAWQLDNSNKSDEAIVADVMQALKSIYGARVPASPVDSLVTHWGRDPFSYGSYSFIAKTAPISPAPNPTLAKAHARVAFAGEACNETYSGTVHGAFGSGRYQAAQLIAAAKGDTPIKSGSRSTRVGLVGATSLAAVAVLFSACIS